MLEKRDIGLGVFRDIDFLFVPTELRVFGHVFQHSLLFIKILDF